MYIADMHCDTIMMLWLARREGKEAYLREAKVDGKDLQIDLLKLKAGGALVQNFALYADLQMEDGTNPWNQFSEMAEIYHAEIAANPDLVREARTYGDIVRNRDEGLISAVLTVEEHSIIGGLGSAVAETLMEAGISAAFQRVGMKDTFGQSGSPAALLKYYGLDAESIANQAKATLARKK